jgi:hypothetical protein
MYTIHYTEVTPEGYIEESRDYISFVIAIKIYQSLIKQPYVNAIIYRSGNPTSMQYIDKVIPF